jgi:hypothetical protein
MRFPRLSLGAFLLVAESLADTCKNPPIKNGKPQCYAVPSFVCIFDFISLFPRRQLDLERRDYIGAVRCLASQPAISGLENAATHFDDF